MRYSWIIAVLLLAGCGGRSAERAVPRTAAPPPQLAQRPAPASDSLAFPVDHAASTLTGRVILGKDTQLRSAGAADDINVLQIADSAAAEYAVYQFTDVSLAIDHLDVALNGAGTTAAWLGLANFTTKRWVFSGPFNTSQRLDLSPAANLSPFGNVYVAVLVAAGEAARVDQLQLFLPNVTPLASFSATPQTGLTDTSVQLDASSSSDLDGGIVKYEWDLDGDGSYEVDAGAHALRATVLPKTTGTLTIGLRVTDDSGESATTTQLLTATNRSPLAALEPASLDGGVGDPVLLDASDSMDSDGSIVKYEWDLDGDGLFELNTGLTATQATTLPSPAGSLTVGLRVTDDAGATATAQQVLTSHSPWHPMLTNDPTQTEPYLNVNEVAPGQYDVRLNIRIVTGDPGYLVEFNPDYLGSGVWSVVPGAPINTTDPMDPVNGYNTNGPHLPTVRVNQPTPGAYYFAVRCTDMRPGVGGDLSGVYVFNHQVVLRPNQAAQFTAEPQQGNPGTAVQLNASASHSRDGNIVQYEWDLNGDWVFEIDGGSAPTQTTTLPDPPGTVDVHLRVTDDQAHVFYATVQLSSVQVQVPPSSWQTRTLTSQDDTGQFASAALVNGHPAVCYYDNTYHTLCYQISSTVDGTAEADWAGSVIDAQEYAGPYCSLGVINGKPAVSYFDGATGSLKYAVASTADGLGNWYSLTVDPQFQVGLGTALAEINGHPAISYYDAARRDLRFAYSSDAAGTMGWTTLPVDSAGDVGQFNSMVSVAGKPGISYYDATKHWLKFAHSTLPDGSGGWKTLTVDSTADTGQYCSLALIGGYPAIAYFDAAARHLKYARCSSVTGGSGWSCQTVDGAKEVGSYCSLGEVAGRPAVSYFDALYNHLKFTACATADGTGSWSSVKANSTNGIFAWTSMVQLATGYPGIFYCDTGTHSLRYSCGVQP